MYVVRNTNTGTVVAVFASRVDVEVFLNVGNNRNIFSVE